MKITKPFFSVIIPTYNRARSTIRAVASVLAQFDEDFEVIVIDDCSTDETMLHLGGIKDHRLRVMKNEINSGQNVSRNKGIASSRGVWLAFLDSDDMWQPNHLSSVRDLVGQYSGDDQYLLYSQVIVRSIEDGGRKLPICPKKEDEGVLDYIFLCGGLMQTSGLVASAGLCRRLRFNESIQRHTDIDFSWRAESVGAKFIFNGAPTVVWYTDNRTDRMSARGVADSKRWFSSARPAMNKKSVRVFRALYLAPNLTGISKIIAVFYVLSAVPLIGLAHAMKLMLKIMLPAGLYTILQARLSRMYS